MTVRRHLPQVHVTLDRRVSQETVLGKKENLEAKAKLSQESKAGLKKVLAARQESYRRGRLERNRQRTVRRRKDLILLGLLKPKS